jgi:hypothetical protein
MKLRWLPYALLSLLPAFAFAAGASAIGDIVRAQVILGQVQQTLNTVKQVQGVAGAATTPVVTPAVPTPVANKSGKYFAPYTNDGQLAGWAQKAMSAQVGAAIGAKAGEKAGSMAASKIPLAGGLLAMGAKKKGKELGALAAVGGADYIKKSSDASFNSVQELALYMHLKCAANPDYVKAFAATMAVYPDLEKYYESAIKQAYAVR